MSHTYKESVIMLDKMLMMRVTGKITEEGNNAHVIFLDDKMNEKSTRPATMQEVLMYQLLTELLVTGGD